MGYLTPEQKDEINLKVAELTSRTVIALRAEQNRAGINSNSGNLKRVNIRYTKKYGLVYRISFKFRRYGVFIEKGAGRGHGGLRGSRWMNKDGVEVRTNPNSFGKMNTGKRKAKPWFDDPIENFADELAKIAADQFVHLSFKNLRIK